jgi:hypothetical protein
VAKIVFLQRVLSEEDIATDIIFDIVRKKIIFAKFILL